MTLESMLSALSTAEKIEAMNILWRELSKTPAEIISPQWHKETLAERLAQPSSKRRLTIDAAIDEVRDQLNARRTQG